MNHPDDDTDRLHRYLLGDLGDNEAAALEVEVLADAEVFDALAAAEDELYDAWARGELSAADRRRFEARFLADAGGAERASFAAVLARRADASAPERSSREARGRLLAFPSRVLPKGAPVRVLALAATLLLAVGLWLGVAVLQLDRDVERLEAERAALVAERAELSATLERERAAAAEAPARPPVVTSFLLALGVRGAEDMPRLRLAPEVDAVALQVEVEGGDVYRAFRVRLRRPGGAELWSSRTPDVEVDAWGVAVAAQVPAPVLAAAGRFVLELEALGPAGEVEQVGIYDFEVAPAEP